MRSSATVLLAESREKLPHIPLDEATRDAAVRAAGTIESWSADDPMTIAQLREHVAGDDVLVRLGRTLSEYVNTSRAVIVEQAPVDDAKAILALFAALALPANAGNGSGTIHRIAHSDGLQSDLSETAAEFAPHTDSTFLRNPHDLLALACVRSDGDGGRSFLFDVDSVIGALSPQDVEALSEPVFQFWLNDPLYGLGRHYAPILGEYGVGTARYRRDVIAVLMAGGDRAGKAHRAALRRLDAVLDEYAERTQFPLAPGQLLLVDNRRVLHGRTPLGSNGARALLRLKGYWPERSTYKVA